MNEIEDRIKERKEEVVNAHEMKRSDKHIKNHTKNNEQQT